MREQTIQAKKYDILGIRFDLIAYNVAMETIERWRRNCEQHYVTITNPHSVMMCRRDIEMRKATERASLTLPDGVGIILAASLLGYPHNGRATGPMLMLKLCDWGREHGYRHYFYGGDGGVAEKLREKLCREYPGLQVAGTYSPPFRPLSPQEDRAIVERINSAKPDIVWVGLGAPKQEKWMAEHLERIQATAMIGVGAAFDFHSEKVKWAPVYIRKTGLEWLYRTIREPWRIGPKAMDNLLFAVRVLCFCLKRKLRVAD